MASWRQLLKVVTTTSLDGVALARLVDLRSYIGILVQAFFTSQQACQWSLIPFASYECWVGRVCNISNILMTLVSEYGDSSAHVVFAVSD